jgi:hypothetical protein
MMSGSSRGFSLVEVVLAFTVLALAIVPVIGMMRTATHQSHQTADFGQALIIAERTAEQLRLANWENPHLPAQVEDQPSMGEDRKLVDGDSPFFSVVEDSVAPYGLIRAGEDLAITRDYAPLYRVLSPFSLGFQSKARTLTTTGQVLDMTLKVSWVDHLRHKQQLTLPVALPRHGVPDDTPEVFQDQKAADAQVLKQLYPSAAGQTLEQVVKQNGANLQVIRALGEAALLGQSFVKHSTVMHNEEQQLLAELAKPHSDMESVRLHMNLGQVYERMAKARLGAVTALAEPLTHLAENYDHADLGSPAPDDDLYLDSVCDLASMGPAFEWELYGAVNAYMDCIEPPLVNAVPQRMRTRILLKVIDLTKLMVLTCSPQNLSFLRQLLGNLMVLQDGHNPNFTAFAQHELDCATSVETLEEHYPVRSRWQKWAKFTRAVGGALDKVSEDLDEKHD